MLKLQYIDELAKTIRKKNRKITVNNDDAYLESVLSAQMDQLIQEYLVGDEGGSRKVILEVSSEYVDNFLDFIENNKISETVVFKQIQPTIFEIKLKDLQLF